MVAATRSLLALLLCRVLLGGAAGLMPEVGRRRFSEPGRAASAAQRPEDLLGEFELRLLHMFGLKRRPSPGKDVVIPPYMLDLYRLHAGQQLGYPLERAASRANTVRSFHHEGRGRGTGGESGRRAREGRRRGGGAGSALRKGLRVRFQSPPGLRRCRRETLAALCRLRTERSRGGLSSGEAKRRGKRPPSRGEGS